MAGNDVDYTEELRLYRDDERNPCKYGYNCYQKNAAHHEKYKHPPDKRPRDKDSEDTATKLSLKKAKHSESEESSKEEDCVSETVLKRNDELIITLSDDLKEAIKEAFLVEMPEDFFSFWSYCKHIKSQDPAGALKDVGLLLVGPFDLFEKMEYFKNCKKPDFLRHWRFYFDPPEFQTVIKGDDTTEHHLGYYRDAPQAAPCFVASNCSAVDCIITPVAENLFGAVNSYLESRKSKSDPFHKMKISSLQRSLQSWAKGKGFDLDSNTSAMKSRSRKVVAKTFHRAGIVVPVNKDNDTGYRPLLEKEADLKKILNNYAKSANEDERKALMNKLQPVITAADIANDECDFGTSLELGHDLFSYGGEMFHGMILHLLGTAYSLLNREVFSEILQVHLKERKKGVNLSIIEKTK